MVAGTDAELGAGVETTALGSLCSVTGFAGCSVVAGGVCARLAPKNLLYPKYPATANTRTATATRIPFLAPPSEGSSSADSRATSDGKPNDGTAGVRSSLLVPVVSAMLDEDLPGATAGAIACSASNAVGGTWVLGVSFAGAGALAAPLAPKPDSANAGGAPLIGVSVGAAGEVAEIDCRSFLSGSAAGRGSEVVIVA